MSKAYTILYEESTPSRLKIAYYDSIAAANGFEFKWQSVQRSSGDYTLLANGGVDGILADAKDDFQEILDNDFKVVVSERGERRLVALFSSFIDLKNGEYESLTLSAEYDWQAEMVSRFLGKALPIRQQGYNFDHLVDINTVDERLYSVLKGETDVAVFSMADINLQDAMVSPLRFMVLPLFECPPGIHQGTTIMLIKTENELSSLLREHANVDAVRHYYHESRLLNLYPGIGNGIVHVDLPLSSFTYFSRIEDRSLLTGWNMEAQLPELNHIFSTTEFMKDFFDYEFDINVEPGIEPVVFVASHKAIHSEMLRDRISPRRVWAAGSKTWFELAKQGVWVEGSADGLGLETLIEPWSHLFNIHKDNVAIVTNKDSAEHWREDGWTAVGTYQLIPAITPEIIEGIRTAQFVFWTSYQQYEACRQYLPEGLKHGSPAGKTAVLLQKDGIKDLIVFPSIKAYTWLMEKRQTGPAEKN